MHDARKSELRLRLLSALVLAPAALAVIVAGSPWIELFLTAAAVAMAWEWDRLSSGGRFGASGVAAVTAVVGTGVASWYRQFDIALLILIVGAVIAYNVAWARGRSRRGWAASGVFVIGVPLAAALWLRADPEFGLRNLIWLVGTVWATDIGGYVVGRWIGGARLAPKISPGKTWSGLAGAVVMAGCWGLAYGYWSGVSALWLMGLLGATAGVVAQGGDLGVSFVKRRSGVKDASNLIPGHGGVLDRCDGLLSTAPLLALLIYLSRGGKFLWE